MKLALAARGRQEEGFTQPLSKKFARRSMLHFVSFEQYNTNKSSLIQHWNGADD